MLKFKPFASNVGPSQNYEEISAQIRTGQRQLHVSCYLSMPKEIVEMHHNRWSNYQKAHNTLVECTIIVIAIRKQNETDSIDEPSRERMLCQSGPNPDSVSGVLEIPKRVPQSRQPTLH